MVSSIISLIHPLKFMGDYRPYATLYEEDIKQYIQLFKAKKKPFFIAGTCNPHIAKVCSKLAT